ncbi:MAG: hypothetical protein AB4041_10650 [Microcystaceae cyanobacterium]
MDESGHITTAPELIVEALLQLAYTLLTQDQLTSPLLPEFSLKVAEIFDN